MARTYEIFASREDLLSLLETIEKDRPLQYVEVDLSPIENPPVRHSARSIEDLGVAKRGDQNHEPIFLVKDQGLPVASRAVPQRRGGTLYAIDQRLNPKSIVIKVGGEYKDEALIAGQIGTVSKDPDSLSLMKAFGKEIRKTFKKEKAGPYWLSPGAERALQSGLRLTASLQAPKETDLKVSELA